MLSPFILFCKATLPTAFGEELSYYETLVAFQNFLNQQVIPAYNALEQNTNNFETNMTNNYNELMTVWKQMQEWINHYFDNLDVQEEINNKVDELVSNGTLNSILANYYQLTPDNTIYFETLHSTNISSDLQTQLNAGKTVVLTKPITLNSNVVVTATNCELYGGKINTNGFNISFSPVNSNQSYTITNINGTQITLETISDFEIGDLLLFGTRASNIVFYSYVRSVNNNIINISDVIPYTLKEMTVKKVDITNISLHDTIINGNGIIGFSQYVTGANIYKNEINIAYVNVNGFNINIYDNIFQNNSPYSIQVFIACTTTICNNRIINFYNGIRCIWNYNTIIKNNILINGLSEQYGVGIEIANQNQVNVMCCYNKIIGNEIHGATRGRPGSGIGGIHLNFYPHHNIISHNLVTACSIGIYLENGGSYNTIDSNNCSNNIGYYGVGIQLDWSANNNIISNNICNYNIGSQTANESYGIEIRTGQTNIKQIDHYNTIISNQCNYNGKAGIYCNGYGTIVSNNQCFNNGSETFQQCGGIVANSASNLMIINNILGNNYNNDLYLSGTLNRISFIIIQSNYLYGNAILQGVNVCKILSNTLYSGNITIESINTNTNLGVVIKDNYLYGENNEINLSSCLGYIISDNIRYRNLYNPNIENSTPYS